MTATLRALRCSRVGVQAAGGGACIASFHGEWEEVGTLGIGARGPVMLVQRRGSEIGGSPQQRSALKRSTREEVLALKALAGCSNVVKLEEHFSGSVPGDIWARLELLTGGSLRNYLRALGPREQLPEHSVRFLLRELFEGLQAIHQLGWMHRDVKAENVGLSPLSEGFGFETMWSVKLMDFDSAVRIPRGRKLSEVIGTVENMAPEVYEGSYDELADCWSIGVVAYELLFGYRPFNDACIERVEEMVRNWERYLLLPFDAAEEPSDLVQGLLTGCENRLSSRAAAQHCWLAYDADIVGSNILPAARVAVPMMEQHSAAVPPQLRTPVVRSSGSSATTFQHKTGFLSSRVPACEPEVEPEFVLPRGSDEEILVRIRRSLSEWVSVNFDGDSAQTHWVREKLQDSKRDSVKVGGHKTMQDSSDKLFNKACKTSTTTADGLEDESTPSLMEAGSSAEWHRQYLRRTRERTEAMLIAMAQRSANLPPTKLDVEDEGGSVGVSGTTVQENDTLECQVGLETMTSDMSDMGGDTFSVHLDHVRNHTRDLLHKLATATANAENSSQVVEPAGQGGQCRSSVSESQPGTATQDDVFMLEHLHTARAKTQELLRRLSVQPDEVPKTGKRPNLNSSCRDETASVSRF